MSIVRALIDQVDVEVRKSAQRGRVLGLDLVIGRLSGVHVDSIRFAFELLSPGTPVEGADLRIEEPPAHLKCHQCGAREPIDELTVRCAQCGSSDVSVEGGQDLMLQSIELSDEEAGA